MLKDRVLKFLKLDGLVDGLSGYIETRVSLLKIEVKEEIIELISKILVGLLIFGTMIFALLLLSFAAAYAISLKLGVTAGFIIVAGIYVLLMLVFYLFRNEIKAKLETVLNKVTQKKET